MRLKGESMQKVASELMWGELRLVKMMKIITLGLDWD
jgi:hypothetical protein